MNHWQVLLVFLLASIINCSTLHDRPKFDFNEESDDDNDNDHLYATIDCNVGDEHDYVMATQSSLFNSQDDDDIQIKTRFKLKCLQKMDWLNQTDNRLMRAQLFQVSIQTLQPIRLKRNDKLSIQSNSNQIDNSNRPLQMASLFAALKDLDNQSNKTDNFDNLKVGAVNGFFAELSKRFGDWFTQLIRKFVEYIRQLMSKSRQSGSPLPMDLFQCNFDGNIVQKNNSRNNRIRRSNDKFNNHKPIDLEQFTKNYSDLYKHPFKFLQLSDGSIQSVQISELDTDPNVIQYKKFIARAFGTQLDERKKRIIENDDLGIHYCNYQMEFDEPKVIEPNSYLKNRNRTKRFDDHESKHVVSVLRQFKNDDIIVKRNPKQFRPKMSIIRDSNDDAEPLIKHMDFDVQEVQLIRDNMVVASGGYFQGFMPGSDANRINRRKRSNNMQTEWIDTFLRKHLNLNMQYSMVKLNNIHNQKRIRRSSSMHQNESDTPSSSSSSMQTSTAIINYADKIVKRFERSSPAQTQHRPKREAVNSELNENNKNVICNKYRSSSNWWQTNSNNDNNQRENEIDFDSKVIIDQLDNHYDNDAIECYEHKRFGSNLISVNFNRSILTKFNSKSDSQTGKMEKFETKYKLSAKLFDYDLISGQINLIDDKLENNTKLSLNLFGSTYDDLNICQIRDRDFQQSGTIPLFIEDIWFRTNIALKLFYKLNFKLDLPYLDCNGQPTMNQIITRAMNDQLELKQNAKLEFSAIAQANLLVVNAQMRLNGKFDMDSSVDFTGDANRGNSCLSARTFVKPMNVNVDVYYEFYHPICNKWMMDSWKPKPLSWKLSENYRQSWTPNDFCADNAALNLLK